jgi:hypothetical protein
VILSPLKDGALMVLGGGRGTIVISYIVVVDLLGVNAVEWPIPNVSVKDAIISVEKSRERSNQNCL